MQFVEERINYSDLPPYRPPLIVVVHLAYYFSHFFFLSGLRFEISWAATSFPCL